MTRAEAIDILTKATENLNAPRAIHKLIEEALATLARPPAEEKLPMPLETEARA